MKRFKIFISVAFITLIMMDSLSSVVSALETYSLSTLPVSDVEKAEFWENCNFEIIDEQIGHNSINCFDVSSSGRIAIGVETNDAAMVFIYDAEGQFQYGYRFICNAFMTIFFEGENLSIYFGKVHYICTFDTTGNWIDLRQDDLSQENSDLLSEIRKKPTEKKIGDKIYRVERDFGLDDLTYSRFVIEDAEGKETLVYDVSTDHNVRIVLLITCLVVLVVCVIVKNVKKLIESERTE